ncbi:uncharacterized protein LOC126388232 isoform X2 [Epinephelus moara]|uniref:uncharacterized protein LOC126388232 isoform X2 n=1 Tax=Epinephelus moara TaxID=300413 RepID=UPI00214EE2B9|nr:uncharacterized protein LOC126388232 isoform X2 [Epinephelus moara]
MRACSSNHPIRACRLAASKAPAGKQMHSCQGADTAATAHGNCNSKWSRGGRGDGQKSRVTPSGGGPVAPGATAAACRASACHSPVEKVVCILLPASPKSICRTSHQSQAALLSSIVTTHVTIRFKST